MERVIDVEPERVWAVLQQPAAYPRWVLGMPEVRRADPDWPRPGSSFDYGFRWGPVGLSGRATSLASHPPNHLRLRWRGHLLGESTAELTGRDVTSLDRLQRLARSAGR